MRVLVCGGRDFRDVTAVYHALDQLDARYPITHLIQGGARGVDEIAAQWAELATRNSGPSQLIGTFTARPRDLSETSRCWRKVTPRSWWRFRADAARRTWFNSLKKRGFLYIKWRSPTPTIAEKRNDPRSWKNI